MIEINKIKICRWSIMSKNDSPLAKAMSKYQQSIYQLSSFLTIHFFTPNQGKNSCKSSKRRGNKFARMK